MTVQAKTVLTGCLAPTPGTAMTGCLTPIDKDGLEKLIAAGKANPNVIKTLKCKTVAEGRFRHLNFIRNLPAYIVDEPPGLLGDDTAPNPSEAVLSALGSCLAVGHSRQRGRTRHHRLQARDRARGRPQHHRRLGHGRSLGEAGRLHRHPRQGDVRGRPPARGARRARRPRQVVVARRQHHDPSGQPRRRARLSAATILTSQQPTEFDDDDLDPGAIRARAADVGSGAGYRRQ